MPATVNIKSNIAAVLANLDGYRADVVDKAIPRALNRTGEMAITAASREIRSAGYNFTASEIKAAMRQIKASQSQRTTTIKTKRTTKSLMDFNPRESKAGVTVKIAGARKLIKGAFIAQRANGAYGVYIEDKAAGKIIVRRRAQYKRGSHGGWHAFPCRKLYGPSVGGVYSTERLQQIMQALIASTFEARLTHEITNLSR